jgi:hypothetical protein
VIAHDGRLDDARAISVRAGRDGEHQVREVRKVQWVRLVRGYSRAALDPGNRLTHHRTEFVVGHS